MDAFRIIGGARLSGSIAVNGAKNAALPVLTSALLTDQPCRYRNIPLLRDVQTQVKILNTLGIETRWRGRTIETRAVDAYNSTAPYELLKTMRAGVCVLGPLLAKRGHARVSLPGGCIIGERPIDLHLRGLEALGAEIDIDHGYVEARSPKGGLRGAEIYLGGKWGSSVTATHNVMSAAALARGRTVIECAACEPEVVDLAECLNAMGARIQNAGSPRLIIDGVRRLHAADWRVIPDRIEAATFLALGAITRSPIEITRCRPDHLMSVIHVMREMGVGVAVRGRSLRVEPPRRFKPKDVVTLPYPAFPTDCQAQTMVLAALADGASVITERVYPERFMHAAELKRMGADIRVANGQAVVHGVRQLQGAEIMASDLRASAALVLAGLAAKGETLLHRIYHIDRGYEAIARRLGRLGARIERVGEAKP
ncbi:MAG: UDP-N-acetylglucosamine 1-carboxyvinyltransferase [Planctomycetota bacterium]